MNVKKCNICNSDNSTFLFYGCDRLHKVNKTLFKIERCVDCGLVYLYPQPTLEELKKYYPSDYGPYGDGSYVLKYDSFSKLIKKSFHFLRSYLSKFFFKKSKEIKNDATIKRFLDFGCGNGSYLERMRILHPNWELHGFDNSEFALKKTSSKGFKVHSGDLITSDLPNEYFDTIYLSHVIEHLHDPKATMTRIFNLLKIGGEVIVITPNFDSIAAKLFGTYWFALESPRHLFLFSTKTLSRLLVDIGFEIKDVTCVKDSRVEIGSINYLFDRKDMRINFLIWHFLRSILKPFVWVLSIFKKTSIMTMRVKKS